MDVNSAVGFAIVGAASFAGCILCVVYCLALAREVLQNAKRAANAMHRSHNESESAEEYAASAGRQADLAEQNAQVATVAAGLARASEQATARHVEEAKRFALLAGNHHDEAKENREQAREYRDEALLAGPTDGTDGTYVG